MRQKERIKMKRTLLVVAILVVVAVAGVFLFRDKSGAPATPEGAVSEMVGAFIDGRVGDAYKLLPASYKKDVEKVAKAFGDKMDADIWKEAQSLIAEFADLVEVKADVLVEAIDVAEDSKVDEKEMIGYFKKAAPMLKKIGSELSLDMFKSGNVEKILKTSGLAGIAATLGDAVGAKMKSVSEEENESVVAVLVDEDDEETDIHFIKVEDAWVPESMAKGWDEGIAEVLKSINEIDEFKPEVKQQLLGVSAMLKTAIKQAKNADDVEELGQAFMLPLLTLAISGMFESDGDSGGDLEVIEDESLLEALEELESLEEIEE